MTHARLVGLLRGLCVCVALTGPIQTAHGQTGGQQGKFTGKPSMQQIAADLITPPDADYANLDDEAVTRLSLKLANWATAQPRSGGGRDEPATGELEPLLVLATPRQMLPEAVGQWPMLVGSRVSGLRSWQVDWEQNAFLIMVRLATGAVAVQRLSVSDKRQATPPPSMSGSVPSAFDAATVRTGVGRFRPLAFRRDGLPGPGRYASTVVYYDWLSNTALTQVGEPGPAQTSGEPLKLTEGLRASTQFATLAADAGQPVRWSLPAKIDGKSPLSIEVGVDIPAQDSGAVVRRSATGAPLDPPGSAALPITVLLFARDAREPTFVRVVASARLVQAGASPRVQAAVSFDARAHASGAALRGVNQAYVVVGKQVVGPKSVEITR